MKRDDFAGIERNIYIVEYIGGVADGALEIRQQGICSRLNGRKILGKTVSTGDGGGGYRETRVIDAITGCICRIRRICAVIQQGGERRFDEIVGGLTFQFGDDVVDFHGCAGEFEIGGGSDPQWLIVGCVFFGKYHYHFGIDFVMDSFAILTHGHTVFFGSGRHIRHIHFGQKTVA